ncbi:isoleucine--tRNA ligase [Candidatus Falkowbacteria bacterium]|jgi:isoleucyl-tRNA synthetase|nr:isoleucine--tRNA ligase [Candidatus Falkowbacteria bacterium]MBT5503783.1 isoleucine--tRNA ligase [Candidatus Falkowbacteria bacterium]MBT6573929.1 isoleucine--tRNA ligase [Candidatus Falkowbacteria bacterium]MBT7348340.1 isoleucine--tRNA ligase [Candidatus Falkowbacteria bacterium]MBT7500277.1 isoleucine--tRNA ligase [Candidatus Falkowbacteria bacterium]
MAKSQFAQNEEKLIEKWEEKNIFQKTLDKKSTKGNFVFFEGPPTANGKPGIHHVLARAFKDVIPRYKTMQGFHVERKAGWDTHGLPVELQVEKELKISGKPDIEKFGIEEFNVKCKESVWRYKKDWEELTRRIAFWVDMENPYTTYSNDYIESLWWIFNQAHEKGLVYKGYKVVPQCPRCGTALSSHEVAQGYKNVEETSIYIKFKVKDQKDTFILSWTTTPWTLPGNIALAVGESISYVKVKVENEFYILAESLLGEVFEDKVEVVEKLIGKDLLGIEYEPLFPGAVDAGDKKAWFVGKADFVTTEDGTGIVHTAVMYGEDDFQFGLENDLPFVHTVDEGGKFVESVQKWAGKFVKSSKVEKEIVEDLEERSLLLKERMYEHDYPFCWRCDSPLLYYAKDSWFIKMSALKDELIKNNAKINWVPDHIKTGRFGEWLENVKDWAISRQRYWGTPLPIWECDKCEKFEVIGDFAELEKKTGALPKNGKGELDFHRPYVDTLEYGCGCGGQMKRTSDVCDCWFDAGSMPFAQHHYPFENKELVDSGEQYPAEYISEAIDQTRGWFYTLLAVSTFLGKGASYKNVICLGHIRDKDGKKMSKSKGNVIDPWMIADKYGVDALRMHLYTINQPGEPKNFDENAVKDVLRKTVMLLGNVVNFYGMYGEVKSEKLKVKSKNVLDVWIVSKLNLLIRDVTKDLEEYHVFESGRKIMDFIDELSTWYVRRSRDRFKTEGADKENAVATLNYVLNEFVKLIAPFMPFAADSFYQKLDGEKESVHLAEWPVSDKKLIDENVLKDMELARQVVELGLSARDEKQIKVRQPLQYLRYQGTKLDNQLENIIAEELNVKEVKHTKEVREQADRVVKEASNVKVGLNIELTDELKLECLVRELTRQINNLRKNQGLTRTDQVKLVYSTKGEQLKKLFANEDMVEKLKQATLLTEVEEGGGETEVKVNDETIKITLEK